MAEAILAVARGPGGFDKLVVLKSMRRELVADKDLRRMFLEEARVSARLNHANVVQVYEVLDATQPCIVMEYLDGQSMSAIIRRARQDFTLPMRLRVISEVLVGLHYTHELTDYDGSPLNLVHRDVSPENVFVTYDGRVKVLDFGIAKQSNVCRESRSSYPAERESRSSYPAERESGYSAEGELRPSSPVASDLEPSSPEASELQPWRKVQAVAGEGADTVQGKTGSGVIKGKLSYMPREQLLGEDVDRRADVHAVGAMLWHVAAGEKLHRKMDPSEVMRRLLEGRIPRPSSVRQVDPDLEAIVMKALAPNREDRYATALELQVEIDDYLSRLAPEVTAQDVGALVASKFSSEQEERSNAIHAEISRPRSIPPPPTDGDSTTTSGNSTTTSGNSTADIGQRRRSRLWPIVVAASVAGLLLVVLVARALVLPRATPTPSSASAPQPQKVVVRVAASPPEAQVIIDGKRHGDNPVVLRIPPDSDKHEVRAFLSGHDTVVRHVRFDQDVSISLKLPIRDSPPSVQSATSTPSAKARAKPEPPPSIGWQVVPSAPVKHPQPQQNSCSPPYYFKNGIKRYKPDCI